MDIGLLSHSTMNIGDDIQSLAIERLLGSRYRFVDREALDRIYHPTALVLHGWFTHRPASWPPSPFLLPLLASLSLPDHDETRAAFDTEASRDYLRRWGPVGARDRHTLETLRSWDVEAVWSGSTTLTFPRYDGPRGRSVYFVDCWPGADLEPRRPGSHPELDALPEAVRRESVSVGHFDHRLAGLAPADRLGIAASLLERYRRARLVVTTRLQCALSALALGTPVQLVLPDFQPERVSGYEELLPIVRREDLEHGRLDWDPPPPTPPPAEVVEALVRRCKRFLARARNRSFPRRATVHLGATPAGPTRRRPVVGVSLARDPVRRSHLVAQAASAFGPRLQLLPAVDGHELDLDELREAGLVVRSDWYGRELEASEVGCWLSHLFAIDYLASAPPPGGIVVEDDIEFEPDFRRELAKRLDELEAREIGWDLCYLGCNEGIAGWAPSRGRELLPGGFFRLRAESNGAAGTYGYMLSERGAARVLRRLCSAPISTPIDEALRMLMEDELDGLCASPPLVRTGAHSTTLREPQREGRPRRPSSTGIATAWSAMPSTAGGSSDLFPRNRRAARRRGSGPAPPLYPPAAPRPSGGAARLTCTGRRRETRPRKRSRSTPRCRSPRSRTGPG